MWFAACPFSPCASGFTAGTRGEFALLMLFVLFVRFDRSSLIYPRLIDSGRGAEVPRLSSMLQSFPLYISSNELSLTPICAFIFYLLQRWREKCANP